MESADDLLLPDEAAEYLQRLWKRPFTRKDFQNMRLNALAKVRKAERKGEDIPLATLFPIAPVRENRNTTIWRRGDLAYLAATVEPPAYSEALRKPRKKRK